MSTAADTWEVSCVSPMADAPPLHEAIARALDGRITQSELGRRLGVAQPNVSRWMRGVYAPSLEDIRRIEDACERPRGFILEVAGYTVAAATLGELLERDPDLDDAGRAIVGAAYESARGFYLARRQVEDATEDGD